MTRECRRRCVVICLIAIAGSAWASGQEKEWVAFARGTTMSPDHTYLAFFAGPRPSRPPGRVTPPPRYLHLFAVDLDANDVICFPPFTPLSYALAWQRETAADLFAVEDLFDAAADFPRQSRLLGFAPGGKPVVTFSRKFDQTTDSNPDITALGWSPDGKVLAAGGMFSDLHLSFDGGKSFVPTDKVCGIVRLLWADNETLLAEKQAGGKNTEVMTVRVRGRNMESVRTVPLEPPVHLCDTLNGQGICRTEHEVYLGETVFLRCEHRIGLVRADGNYVAITLSPAEGNQQILVCDDQRKVVRKWSVPRTAMLMGISYKRGCVYVAPSAASLRSAATKNSVPKSRRNHCEDSRLQRRTWDLCQNKKAVDLRTCGKSR